MVLLQREHTGEWFLLRRERVCDDGGVTLLFESMKDNKSRWMAENSDVVDCMVVALFNGGMAKDMVVQE